MLKIGIITGSTRPGRLSLVVAEWVHSMAESYSAAVVFDVVDIATYDLPLLDEPFAPILGNYQNDHTNRWSSKVARYDGFIFVTPEYNHSIPSALKNAIDYLYKEWNNKAAGFVSYGAAGGERAVEHLRTILSEVQIAHVRAQVALSLYLDFEHVQPFKSKINPRASKVDSINQMLEQLLLWSEALKTVRDKTY